MDFGWHPHGRCMEQAHGADGSRTPICEVLGVWIWSISGISVAGEPGLGAQHLAAADEGPDDGDVYLHDAVAAQDAG